MQKNIRLNPENYELVEAFATSEGRTAAGMLNRMVELAGLHWDDLAVMDRSNNQMIKEHIVREGIQLGKLPPRPEVDFTFCKHNQVKGMCKKGCK